MGGGVIKVFLLFFAQIGVRGGVLKYFAQIGVGG